MANSSYQMDSTLSPNSVRQANACRRYSTQPWCYSIFWGLSGFFYHRKVSGTNESFLFFLFLLSILGSSQKSCYIHEYVSNDLHQTAQLPSSTTTTYLDFKIPLETTLNEFSIYTCLRFTTASQPLPL